MNDEQLSQPSNGQAEQDNGAPRGAGGNGNIDDVNAVVGQGQEIMAGSVGETHVGDVSGPTQGFPLPAASGHANPEPPTRDTDPAPAMAPDQAEALTSYHPVEPVGETPEQGVEAKAEGETQAAAQQSAPQENVQQQDVSQEAPAAAEQSGTQESQDGTSEGESGELQVVRTTRDRLNEMAPNASMEDLLKASEQQYRALKHGDVIEGTIMKLDREEMLVDIGSKSEGIIPSHESQSLTEEERAAMQIGDEVFVSVVQPENAEGHAILSLDRARQEKSWRDLQRKFEEGEVIQAPVSGYNKGGLLVNLGGVRGFVPASQVSSILPNEPNKQAEMAKLQGTALPLKIIEINRGRNRLILSQRQAEQEQRESRRTLLLRELEQGQIRPGRVSSICDFGAFVDIGGADGLIHLSELSWKRVSHPSDVLKVGDNINVYVLSVDPNERKIALSLKRTQPEPWSTITDNYHIGQIVRGTITQLTNFGAFARLEDGIEGLIHVSELDENRVAHPRNVVKEGETYDLKVIRIDQAKKRIGLSLKRVKEDAEGTQQGGSPVDEDTASEFGADQSDAAPSLADVGPQIPTQQQTPRQFPQAQPRPPQRERNEREQREQREREAQARQPRTQIGQFNIPQPDEDEPMGVMAQAFAALAQQHQTGRGRPQDTEDETGTEGQAESQGESSATAATAQQPEAMMPSAGEMSSTETESRASAQPEAAEEPQAEAQATSDTGVEAASDDAAGAADTAVADDSTDSDATADSGDTGDTDVATDSGDTAEDVDDTQATATDLSTGGPGSSEVVDEGASDSGDEDLSGSGASGSEGAPSDADSGSIESTAEPTVTGTEGETGEDETLG